MIPPCPHTSDGEHRWTFVGHKDRADHYLCINALCNETKMEFMDGESL